MFMLMLLAVSKYHRALSSENLSKYFISSCDNHLLPGSIQVLDTQPILRPALVHDANLIRRQDHSAILSLPAGGGGGRQGIRNIIHNIPLVQ